MMKPIPVEVLINGTWERLPNATAKQIDPATYELTIAVMNVIGRMSGMNDTSFRVDGKESLQVFPGRFYNDTLVFQIRTVD